jgi:hypothetical protein
MATVTKGKTFVSGETVTPPKLNDLVDNATVTNIATADISDSAITTAKINDAAVTFAKQESPQYTGYRNAIINGNFDIWQRGTSVTGVTDNQFVADRWRYVVTGSSLNVSRQPFTVGQTDVTGEPAYFLRSAVTSVAGAGNRIMLIQAIEGVRTFAGQAAILSFWAKAGSSANISVECLQSFGSGGSPSTATNSIGITKFNLTASWQQFTATLNIPTISGKTLGSNNDDSLWLAFWLDAGSDFNARTDTLGQQSGTFDIAQVQIEAGPVATPFERRPIGTELALCQRYYQIGGVHGGLTSFPSTAGSIGGIAVAASTAYAVPSIQFAVRMRGSPTIRTADVAGTIGNIRNFSNNTNTTPVTIEAAPHGITAITWASGQTIGHVYGIQWEASAEL